MSDRQRTITTVDDGGLPVSEAVLETVAGVTGEDPTDLAPLFRAIDPEALEDLLAPRPGGDVPLGLQFEYSGCEVTVERETDGQIVVRVREQIERDDGSGR